MKQNYKKLLMMLPILPLMMANSPAPQRVFNYDDFKMTFVSEEIIDSNYQTCKYTYQVDNYGDGYIYDITRLKTLSSYYYTVYYAGADDDLFYFNQIIAPHSEFTFSYEDGQFDYTSPNVEYAANAYTEFSEDAIISGSFDISLTYEPMYSYDHYYSYFIDLQIKGLNQEKYYYNVILNLKYDDVNYSLLIYETYDEYKKDGYTFSSKEKLDLTKLTLQDNPIVVAQEMYAGYKEPTMNVTAMLIALGIVIGGVIIFCGIYFPIKSRKKNYEE